MHLAAAFLNYGKRCLSSKNTMLTAQEHLFDLFIDGKSVPSASGKTFELVNPSNGEAFGRAANASKADFISAIVAARRAFDNGIWPKMSLADRGIYLKKIASLIRKYAKEFADLESTGCGKTLKQSSFIDVPTAADCFEYFGSIEDVFEDRKNKVDAPVESITAFEPIGVVACVVPWNYPLIMAAWKMAPALTAGNTVVFKPSSLGCASIMRLAQIIKEAELPEGVVNIVTTTDHDAAKILFEHLDVNMVSFTGGTETGKEVARAASTTMKKISLELGGKSPAIVFADCDFDAAMGGVMSGIFMNQGQMCTAGARLILEDKIYDKFLAKLVEKTKSLTIGDVRDYKTAFGPIISRQHHEKILEFIERAKKEGAQVICGGKVPNGEKLKNGFYLEPTILANVKTDSEIFQEEVFGPVLAVVKFSGTNEAIKLANNSKYGLAATVWTKDKTKADEVARKLQCGTVWINTYGGFYNEASFGGYKQSGIGRELGLEGLLEYTQTKHICKDTTPGGRPLVSNWF